MHSFTIVAVLSEDFSGIRCYWISFLSRMFMLVVNITT